MPANLTLLTASAAVAALAVLIGGLLSRSDTNRSRASGSALDQITEDSRALGVRRVTPARRWFSTFTLSLLTHHEQLLSQLAPASAGPSLTLEELDAGFGMLEATGIDLSSEEARNLRDLSRHFRDRLFVEEGGRYQPSMQAVWTGFGHESIDHAGPVVRHRREIRLYNAADLGVQGILRSESTRWSPRSWRRRRLHRRLAVVVSSETPPQASLIDRLILDADGSTGGTNPLLPDLLSIAGTRSATARTTQDLIDLVQAFGQQGCREAGDRAVHDVVRWPAPDPAATLETTLEWVPVPPPIDYDRGR